MLTQRSLEDLVLNPFVQTYSDGRRSRRDEVPSRGVRSGGVSRTRTSDIWGDDDDLLSGVLNVSHQRPEPLVGFSVLGDCGRNRTQGGRRTWALEFLSPDPGPSPSLSPVTSDG